MKISKLFHWLYAILMLLPVFFVGVRCGYVMFNKNAKDSYSGTTSYDVNYKYQSNEVNSVNDLVLGNIYHLYINSYSINNDFAFSGNIISCNLFHCESINDSYTDETNLNDNQLGSLFTGVYLDLQSDIASEELYFNFKYPTLDSYVATYCVADLTDVIDIDLIIQLDFFDYGDYNLFSYSSYNEIESVEIDTSGTLDNAFIYSVNQLNDVPLFSWAKDSFLVAPFSYITGLFGLASTSPINTLLSYWLSISIIWLVFDLVMYLPLLIHRWLDKGVLE